MTNPLHAPYYADQARQLTVPIIENVGVAHDTYRVRFGCPPIAEAILPGQFIMLRLAGFDDPLLGRPLAVYDTVIGPDGNAVGLDVVYLVAGKLTRKLARFCPGQEVQVWGPLGNGFAPMQTDHLIMVAGGIGQTPFLALARECLGNGRYGNPPRRVSRVKKATLCYGVRRAEYLSGVDDFKKLGVDVRLSSDDGSAGHHGLVTDLLKQVLAESRSEDCRIICCGPEPMMKAVAEIKLPKGTPCEVSLETPMACGIGICFSCVAKVRDEAGGWDYRRTCVEGPVFEAAQIEW